MTSLSRVLQTKVIAVLDAFIHHGLSLEEFELVGSDLEVAAEVVRAWKGAATKKGILAKASRPRKRRKLPARPLSESEQKEWQAFYRDVLELEVNLAEVVVPPPTASRRPSR